MSKIIPASVTLYNAAKARENTTLKKQRYVNHAIRSPKYGVGDLVRVSRAENVFTFYGEELCKVRKNLSTDVFKIEKILKSRDKGSSKEYFVKWKEYRDKFNSWIKVSQLLKK